MRLATTEPHDNIHQTSTSLVTLETAENYVAHLSSIKHPEKTFWHYRLSQKNPLGKYESHGSSTYFYALSAAKQLAILVSDPTQMK